LNSAADIERELAKRLPPDDPALLAIMNGKHKGG
jgi:hypothetical protein